MRRSPLVMGLCTSAKTPQRRDTLNRVGTGRPAQIRICRFEGWVSQPHKKLQLGLNYAFMMAHTMWQHSWLPAFAKAWRAALPTQALHASGLPVAILGSLSISLRGYCRSIPQHSHHLLDDSICTLDSPPSHAVNPGLRVCQIAGKGRALITDTACKRGDLIMAVQPMALAHGPSDDMPEPDTLIPQLQAIKEAASISSIRHAHVKHLRNLHLQLAKLWMTQLHQGSVMKGSQQQLQLLQSLLQHPVCGAPASSPSTTQSAQQLPGQDSVNESLAKVDTAAAVAYNAFGDGFEDLAALECRKTRRKHAAAPCHDGHTSAHPDAASKVVHPSYEPSTPQSHVGLWPHFALLNHSCLANCIHYVIGSTMVVRAAEDISPGQEITISYLGREDFSPAVIRQDLLKHRYGFTCACPRCSLEAVVPPSTSRLLLDVHEHVQHVLRPGLLQAVEQEDPTAMQQVGKQLIKWSIKLHEGLHEFRQAVSQPGPGSTSSQEANTPASIDPAPLQQAVQAVGGVEVALLCLEACVYDFVELLHQHAQLSQHERDGDHNPDETSDPLALLRLCIDILDVVSKGSELHVFQACRLLEVVTESDVTGNAVGEQLALGAAELAEEALVARYGHVSPPIMLELARHNAKISKEFIV